MYKIKKEAKEKVKQNTTNRDLAYKIGVTEGYISRIMNARKLDISKTVAYAFTKAVSSESEIEDFFEIF